MDALEDPLSAGTCWLSLSENRGLEGRGTEAGQRWNGGGGGQRKGGPMSGLAQGERSTDPPVRPDPNSPIPGPVGPNPASLICTSNFTDTYQSSSIGLAGAYPTLRGKYPILICAPTQVRIGLPLKDTSQHNI